MNEDIDILKIVHDRNTRKTGAQNINIAVVGSPGLGKSWLALRLCEIYYKRFLNKKFTADNVIFTISEFLNLINKLPPKSFIIFDDSGLKYSNKKWFEELNQILGYTIQSFRFKIINVIFTIPIINFMDKVGVNLLQARVDMIKPSWGNFKRLRFNPYDKKIYEHRIGLMEVAPPNEELTTAYENKKLEYITREYKTYYNISKMREARTMSIEGLVDLVKNDPNSFKIKGRYNARLIQSDLHIPKERAYEVLAQIVKQREQKTKGGK